MRRTPILVLTCLALLLASCGDDGGTAGEGATTAPTTAAGGGGAEDGAAGNDAEGDGTSEADDAEGDGTARGAFPVTVGDVTVPAQPERIVSLSPTATEILFAIGAGDQVEAVDDLSNHPEGAPVTDLSGFDPNLEAIATYEPDLVVVSYDPGELVSGLAELDVPVLVQAPAMTLEDSYQQIEDLGAATGHPEEAAEVVAEMRSRVEEIAGAVAPVTGASVYHELDDTFFSASSSSFIGDLYSRLGLENIADEADVDGTGYPQLNAEYIIEADPDLIVITDDVAYGPAEIAARPGWDTITAVADGNVVQVESDLASRWGPRVVEFMEAIAQQVQALEPAGA